MFRNRILVFPFFILSIFTSQAAIYPDNLKFNSPSLNILNYQKPLILKECDQGGIYYDEKGFFHDDGECIMYQDIKPILKSGEVLVTKLSADTNTDHYCPKPDGTKEKCTWNIFTIDNSGVVRHNLSTSEGVSRDDNLRRINLNPSYWTRVMSGWFANVNSPSLLPNGIFSQQQLYHLIDSDTSISKLLPQLGGTWNDKFGYSDDLPYSIRFTDDTTAGKAGDRYEAFPLSNSLKESNDYFKTVDEIKKFKYPLALTPEISMFLQNDGNLVAYLNDNQMQKVGSSKGTIDAVYSVLNKKSVIWASNTDGKKYDRFKLSDEGYIVLYSDLKSGKSYQPAHLD